MSDSVSQMSEAGIAKSGVSKPGDANTSRTVRIGLVQQAASADSQSNVQRALAGVADAAKRGADVVCLQELFASRYFPQEENPEHFRLAESLDGPTLQAAAEAARANAVTLLAGVFERRAPGVYHNSLIVFGPDGERLGMYRKMHIPDDPQFLEKYYFTPGDLGFVAVRSPKAVLGPLICWDQWYPEAARLTALKGAEMLFYPTAIGWLPEEKEALGEGQLAAWRSIHQAHSIANGVFTVAVNRVGVEPAANGSAIEFWGHSCVIAPTGEVIGEANTGEQVLVVECDLSAIETQRQAWPFFRDRRIDSYGGLSQRWSEPDPATPKV